ncbi:hypothetical protein PENTCL1PPCAC_29697, partial [Pristionchus entomophagus]
PTVPGGSPMLAGCVDRPRTDHRTRTGAVFSMRAPCPSDASSLVVPRTHERLRWLPNPISFDAYRTPLASPYRPLRSCVFPHVMLKSWKSKRKSKKRVLIFAWKSKWKSKKI